jgi:hypothetical protein
MQKAAHTPSRQNDHTSPSKQERVFKALSNVFPQSKGEPQ